MKEKEKNILKCTNCQKEIPSGSSFCPYCGQTTKIKKIGIFDLIRDFFNNFVIFDIKIFRSFYTLLFPGKITKEFFNGKHGRYTSPWRLFLISVVIMVIVINFSPDIKLNDFISINSDNKNVYSEIGSGLKKGWDSYEEDSIPDQFRNDSLKLKKNIDSLINRNFNRNFNIQKIKNKLSDQDFNKLQVILTSLDSSKLDDDLFREVVDSTSYILKKQLKDIYVDSISLLHTKMSKYDVRKLSLNQLKKKYQLDSTKSNSLLFKLLHNIQYKIDAKILTWETGKEFMLKNINWFIIILLPFVALFFKLLYIRRKRYFVEHLVFNIHGHTALLLMHSTYILLGLLSISVIDNIMIYFILYGPPLYYLVAMKKYYEQSWIKTLIKLFIFSFVYFIFILIFAFIYAGIAAVMI